MLESIYSESQRLNCQYEIYIYRQEKLGAGQFGKVYKGYDQTHSRLVALKKMENNKQQAWKKQIKALEMFDNPRIIKYYYYIPEKSLNSDIVEAVYIVTQFVRGKNLDEYINSVGKIGQRGLSQQMVFKLFSQLLEGYREIHSKNFVHRDIKPQNILVDQNQDIKIIDFGQTKQRKLMKTQGLGTPLYAAPQTFTSKNPTDFKRDVWSLGLVLYQMITGKCYFWQWMQCNNPDQFIKFLQTHRVKIKQYPMNFNSFWKQITKKMLQKDYNRRPNLHQIILQLQKMKPQLQKKFSSTKLTNKLLAKKSLLTKSSNINPIMQNRHESRFSRVKKYINFFYHKHKFLILLPDLLKKYSYPFFSNAHKLMVVFLCYSIYVAAVDDFLYRIQDNILNINKNDKINAKQLQQPYRTAFIQLLQSHRDFYKIQSQLTKQIIRQNIIPKFQPPQHKQSCGSEIGSVKSYATNIKQKSIQSYEIIQKFQYLQIKVLAQNFQQGIVLKKAHCIQKFKQLLFSKQFYQHDNIIRQYFYQEDMVIYYLMLIIAYFDQFLDEKHQFIGNQIPKLREQLQNVRRDKKQVQNLLSKINKLNKKQ